MSPSPYRSGAEPSGKPRIDRDVRGFLAVVPNTRRSDLNILYAADSEERALWALAFLDREDGPTPPRETWDTCHVADLPSFPSTADATSLGPAIDARMEAHPLAGQLESTGDLFVSALASGAPPLEVAVVALRALHFNAAARALLAAAGDPATSLPHLRTLARVALVLGRRGGRAAHLSGLHLGKLKAVAGPLPDFPSGKCSIHDSRPLEESLLEYDRMYRAYHTALRQVLIKLCAAPGEVVDAAFEPAADGALVRMIRERIAASSDVLLVQEELPARVAAAWIEDAEAERMLSAASLEGVARRRKARVRRICARRSSAVVRSGWCSATSTMWRTGSTRSGSSPRSTPIHAPGSWQRWRRGSSPRRATPSGAGKPRPIARAWKPRVGAGPGRWSGRSG